jgi:hypothetical protein
MTFEAEKTAESMEDVLPGGKLQNFLGILAKKRKESLHQKEACNKLSSKMGKEGQLKMQEGAAKRNDITEKVQMHGHDFNYGGQLWAAGMHEQTLSKTRFKYFTVSLC